jgi:tRNA pseudouridine38-40 synthase
LTHVPPSSVQRIAVGIEYRGSAFAGWQVQEKLRTVQGEMEKALSEVAAEKISLICAGRTDAGVHAREQVAHFDTQAVRSMRAWTLGANNSLPDDVSVTWAMPVPGHFHARYSAEARTYRYFIFNRWVRSALVGTRGALVFKPLDHERMAAAASVLVGHHDFSALRSAECRSRSPVRRLTQLAVQRDGDWVTIEATANAFLHHMMRNIAGLLISVGRGDHPPEWAREVLEGRDRALGGATAPADGLYLWQVTYPAVFRLPASGGGVSFIL